MTLTSQSTSIRNPSWWKKRSKMEKSLLFLNLMALLLITIMAAILIVIGYKQQLNKKFRKEVHIPDSGALISDNCSNICLTAGCIKAASDILRNLDETVDPCHDFYEFACGGWLSSHTIPDDSSQISVFSKTQDELDAKLRTLLTKPLTGKEPDFIVNMKKMYDTCMDTESIAQKGVEPLRAVISELGGWPVLEGEQWYIYRFDWIETLVKLRNMGYSHHVFMYLSVTADYKNNSRNIIELDQAHLGMPDRNFFLRSINDTITSAYIKFMVKTAVQLGADFDRATQEMNEVFEFEKQLANISLSKEERRNYTTRYNRYTVKELEDIAPEIEWYYLARELFSSETISLDEPIMVAVPSFVKEFAKLIDATNHRTIANYLIWRVVKRSLPLLSQEWRELSRDYTFALNGKQTDEPRREICQHYLTGTLSVALGSYYIRHYFKDSSRDVVMEMVDYIQKEFLNILEDVEWMEEETRARAIEKANTILPFMGYPNELLNDSAVSEYYSNLVLGNDSFMDNVLRAKRWSTDYAFSQLHKPNIKGEWTKHADAAVVNAMYESLENSIDFPAGILENAFFSEDRPNYLNFGGIGFVIGHEITHGFDDEGRQFDKEGHNENWWDPKTDQLFREKTQCIINQYGSYIIPEIGENVNGINTQGENIADNGGLKEAYLAYQAWVRDNGPEPQLPGLKYTPGQLFWISAANIWCGKYKPAALKLKVVVGRHSPIRFRVIGTVSNLNEFAKEYDCPLGSPMNPAEKCKVW